MAGFLAADKACKAIFWHGENLWQLWVLCRGDMNLCSLCSLLWVLSLGVETSLHCFIYVTHSHEMTYLHVSSPQILLIIWYLDHVSAPKNVVWCVFGGCMCGGGHFEKISFNVFTVHWVLFPLILSNRRFKCTCLYNFWHGNISNIGAPAETWNFNFS